MDLLKPFDTINNELLFAKWHVYGFSADALEVIYDIDSKKSRSIKISVLGLNQLLRGVLQRPVLDPILSNIYINNIFFALKGIDTCNFAGDTILYVCNLYLKSVRWSKILN